MPCLLCGRATPACSDAAQIARRSTRWMGVQPACCGLASLLPQVVAQSLGVPLQSVYIAETATGGCSSGQVVWAGCGSGCRNRSGGRPAHSPINDNPNVPRFGMSATCLTRLPSVCLCPQTRCPTHRPPPPRHLATCTVRQRWMPAGSSRSAWRPTLSACRARASRWADGSFQLAFYVLSLC